MKTVFELIEDNGLTLHGDIEHFAELVRGAERERTKKMLELASVPPRKTWSGLTELEKAEITSLKWWDWEDTFDIEGFIRAIEAKLKEKNG